MSHQTVTICIGACVAMCRNRENQPLPQEEMQRNNHPGRDPRSAPVSGSIDPNIGGSIRAVSDISRQNRIAPSLILLCIKMPLVHRTRQTRYNGDPLRRRFEDVTMFPVTTKTSYNFATVDAGADMKHCELIPLRPPAITNQSSNVLHGAPWGTLLLVTQFVWTLIDCRATSLP